MLHVPAPLAVFCCLASSTAGYNNGQPRVAPMGWNTWCTQGDCGLDVCNEAEIKRVARAMMDNGMHAVGYRFINL